MKNELSKVYNPKSIEEKWYTIWEEAKSFQPNLDNSSDTFTYENSIYTKKITSAEAQNMLTSIFNNRCNYKTFKLVAHQLGVRF